MTPFQSFRFWARRAPAGERLAALIAAAVVIGLGIWVAVPSNGSNTNTLSAYPGATPGGSTGTTGSTGSSTGSAATTGSSGTTGSTGSTTGSTGTTGFGSTGSTGATSGSSGSTATGTTGTSSTGTTGPQGCASPPGTAHGLTSKTMNIAIAITDIAGPAADSTFGVADPRRQRAAYQAVVDDLNAHGGIACRKISATFYNVNAADPTSRTQACNSIVHANVYAVLDSGAFAGQSTDEVCFAKAHIPYFTAYVLPDQLRRQYYPYLFSFGTYEAVYRDTIFGLRDRGFFDPKKGASQKIGVLVRSCYKDVVSHYFSYLHAAGVPDSRIVKADVGCPQVFATPIDLQNAVRRFKAAGVNRVTYVQFLADFGSFTSDAQQQNFHPKYGLPDDQLVTLTQDGTLTKPNANNLNGAIAITLTRDGEENTPALRKHPTAPTVRCNKIVTKRGHLNSTYDELYAIGNACDNLWQFQAAVEHAPSVVTNALAAGMQASRTVPFSFPQAPNFFATPGQTAAGQYWRPLQYAAACGCWHVIDPVFTRGAF